MLNLMPCYDFFHQLVDIRIELIVHLQQVLVDVIAQLTLNTTPPIVEVDCLDYC